MTWIIIILALLGLLTTAADIHFYRRRLAHVGHGVRAAFIIGICVVYLLPALTWAILRLSTDNSTSLMLLSMWLFWIFFLLTMPRLSYYLFLQLGSQRVGIVAAVFVALTLVWGATYGRTRLRIEQIEVRLDRLPAAFDGFRIVLFSDTHLGTLISPAKELTRLVEAINAQHPDLVVFSGDLINIRYTELDTLQMRILSNIEAPYGVLSTIGNHDTGVYVKDTSSLPVAENMARLIERQHAMGWRVLDNTTEYLVRDNDTLAITGISFDPAFRWQRHDRTLDYDLRSIYADTPPNLCNITISHLPQLWEQITQEGFGDLTLSGHVHAMQLSLNIGPWRLSPAQLMYKHWSGLYEDTDGHKLYINDGTGYVGYPMRLGVYPEVTVITLRK